MLWGFITLFLMNCSSSLLALISQSSDALPAIPVVASVHGGEGNANWAPVAVSLLRSGEPSSRGAAGDGVSAAGSSAKPAAESRNAVRAVQVLFTLDRPRPALLQAFFSQPFKQVGHHWYCSGNVARRSWGRARFLIAISGRHSSVGAHRD